MRLAAMAALGAARGAPTPLRVPALLLEHAPALLDEPPPEREIVDHRLELGLRHAVMLPDDGRNDRRGVGEVGEGSVRTVRQ